jgi:hypothetical protein
MFDPISSFLSMLQEPDVRLFFASVVFYFLSFFYFYLPPSFRALLHFSFGIAICFLCYGALDTFSCFSAALLSYLTIVTCPSWVSIILAVGVCEASHIVIYLRNSAWSYDCTAWTMVYMQKVISLTFNIRDGRVLKTGGVLPRERWVSVSVAVPPRLLPYLAWMYSPIGNYSLPFVEYAPFAYTLEARELQPGRRREGVKKFLECCVNAFYVAAIMSRITWETTYGSKWFAELHPIVRSIFCPIFTALWLSRYFAATILVDAIGLNTGLYDSGLVQDSELSNHSIFWTLKCKTVTEWYQRWNHTTHLFWKNYLFTRLLDKKVAKSIANWSVYLASMLWHGVRPVYLSLLPEAVLIGTMDAIWEARMGSRLKIVRWLLIPYGNLYVNCAWFFPTWEGVIGIRKLIWFWPTVTWVIVGIVAAFVPKQRTERKDKKE